MLSGLNTALRGRIHRLWRQARFCHRMALLAWHMPGLCFLRGWIPMGRIVLAPGRYSTISTQWTPVHGHGVFVPKALRHRDRLLPSPVHRRCSGRGCVEGRSAVDSARIVVSGASQAGGLGLVAALPDVLFMCHFSPSHLDHRYAAICQNLPLIAKCAAIRWNRSSLTWITSTALTLPRRRRLKLSFL